MGAPTHQYGDMLAAGRLPPRFLAALETVADELHPAFEREPDIIPGKSKESCILASLAVRDFLRLLGFRDARVRPVVFLIHAWKGDELVHSLGIGVPGEPDEEKRWNGHMVVSVPSVRALVDTTLYPVIRPAWAGLPPMITARIDNRTPIYEPGLKLRRLAALASRENDYAIQLQWLDNPRNVTWKDRPDTEPIRRQPVVGALLRRAYETRSELL